MKYSLYPEHSMERYKYSEIQECMAPLACAIYPFVQFSDQPDFLFHSFVLQINSKFTSPSSQYFPVLIHIDCKNIGLKF